MSFIVKLLSPPWIYDLFNIIIIVLKLFLNLSICIHDLGKNIGSIKVIIKVYLWKLKQVLRDTDVRGTCVQEQKEQNEKKLFLCSEQVG